jgi:hypothetical protein
MRTEAAGTKYRVSQGFPPGFPSMIGVFDKCN